MDASSLYRGSKDQPSHSKLKSRPGPPPSRDQLKQILLQNKNNDSVETLHLQDPENSESRERAELMVELEKIRAEKLCSNPLLNPNPSTKKAWNEDVVFNVMSTRSLEPAPHTNDTIRSEFHTKFMEKYIK